MIHELRNELFQRLAPLIDRRPFALLDFPQHSNVGDSAIWLGELRLLRQLTGRRPRYVCTHQNCNWTKLSAFDGTIFLSGGGNFGDLYPEVQHFREEVLRRLAGRRVIQLPQSIHFGDEGNLARARATIAEHGAFVLCVRDRRSLAIAQSFGCEAVLAPDAAFLLDLQPQGPQTHDVIYLHRTDDEGVEPHASDLPAGWTEADWMNEPPALWAQIARRVMVTGPLTGRLSRDSLREMAYRAAAEARVRRGTRLLSSGRIVVTDRLHGHILATLLGITNYVADNRHGKVSEFISAWRTDRPGSPAHRIDDYQAFLDDWRDKGSSLGISR